MTQHPGTMPLVGEGLFYVILTYDHFTYLLGIDMCIVVLLIYRLMAI